MGWIFFIVVVAACVGGVVWNHRTAAEAMGGVEFAVAAAPEVVRDAIRAAYCDGRKAVLKAMVFRLDVSPAGPSSFAVRSSIGDAGQIDVATSEGGSSVRAHTFELYIGSHPSSHFRRGTLGFSAQIIHAVYKVLGLAPSAGKMKRFQQGIERNVAAQLRKRAAA